MTKKGLIISIIMLALTVTLLAGRSAEAAWVDNHDGTVSDTRTGLVWQQLDDQNNAGGRIWKEALAYCEGLKLAGKSDWRLPNIRELESIVDDSCYSPACNAVFECRSGNYWSGSTGSGSTGSLPDVARTVDFTSGQSVNSFYRKYHNWPYVRCVRQGKVIPLHSLTIAQTPISGPPGVTFVQSGSGFSPNKTATLHFKKPDGTEYSPTTVKIDSSGSIQITYNTPMDKPPGTYTWWAIDNFTGAKSNIIEYVVIEPEVQCSVLPKYKSLMKIDNPSCREQWNMAIFYAERLKMSFEVDQVILQHAIQGELDANKYCNKAIEALSEVLDLYSLYKDYRAVTTYALKPSELFLIGAKDSLKAGAYLINNDYAKIMFNAFSAGVGAALDPYSTLTYALTTNLGTGANIFTAFTVYELTQRQQELEIAKQVLLHFYQYGSRLSLLATKQYGLSSNASINDIVKKEAQNVTSKYSMTRVLNIIIASMNAVAMKQAEYTK